MSKVYASDGLLTNDNISSLLLHNCVQLIHNVLFYCLLSQYSVLGISIINGCGRVGVQVQHSREL